MSRPASIGAPIEMPTVGDALPTPSSPTQDRISEDERCTKPGTRFRCLIVTRVLDSGGVDEFVAFLARQLPLWGGIRYDGDVRLVS